MAKVVVVLSMSSDGDTPSRYNDQVKLSKSSAEFFDAGVDSCGAVVTGRRTYDIARAWGGNGPIHGRPVFVLTHEVPAELPEASVPYTYVTDGVESAIRQAKEAAQDKNVASPVRRPHSNAFGPDCSTRS
jgi:dihydrofolate reductase